MVWFPAYRCFEDGVNQISPYMSTLKLEVLCDLLYTMNEVNRERQSRDVTEKPYGELHQDNPFSGGSSFS